jgi:hypothetical protein
MFIYVNRKGIFDKTMNDSNRNEGETSNANNVGGKRWEECKEGGYQ